ncbi:MAG: hypothetical protein AAF585_18265 [Verrucomicrobiota bacterium]
MTIVLSVLAIFIFRALLGIVTGAIHYNKTPTFAEYIASNPVSEETIEELIPEGDPIDTSDSWSIGEIDPLSLKPSEGDHLQCGQTLHINITRGDESLLSLKQEFKLALRLDDWSQHGVNIEVQELETAPGLRAIVVTSLSDPDEMIGAGSMAKGGAVVEVFLVSGDAPSESRFQYFPGGKVRHAGTGADKPAFPLWRLLSGITHNLKPLPEEGLIHHTRQRVLFSWKKYKDGHGGPSKSYGRHTVNTSEYSYGIEIQIDDSLNGSDSGSMEITRSLKREWNGEVW